MIKNEIKLRAWFKSTGQGKNGNCMLYTSIPADEEKINKYQNIITPLDFYGSVKSFSGEVYLMPCVEGLKDIDNRDVYQDDLVWLKNSEGKYIVWDKDKEKNDRIIYKVTYINGCFCLAMFIDDEVIQSSELIPVYEIIEKGWKVKVIGNVWEGVKYKKGSS